VAEVRVESAASTERSGPTGRLVGLIVGGGLFLFLMFAPGLPLDRAQRAVAATTALTAVLWVTVAVPVAAASLVPVTLFTLLGVMPASQAAPLYMGDLVMLFLGAFIVALGLERWDVHKRIALFVIDSFGSSRRSLVLGFMVAAAFLSFWINNTATTLLMLPIARAVVLRIEGDDENRSVGSSFAVCLLLGVAYSSSAGGMATPVGTAPNQVFLGQMAEKFPDGPKITFGEWMLAWTPLVVLFVPMAWLLLTRWLYPVPRGGGEGREVIRAERARLGPMTRAQRRMSLLFAATAILWVTRADITLGSLEIPGWSRLFLGARAADPAWYAENKNWISDSTVALGMALIAFLVPAGTASKDFLMDWRTASRLPWEVLLLLGGGFCIAKGFEVSGLDLVLGERLEPLFSGGSTWLIVGGVTLFMSILTEFTSNTATTAVLLPVLGGAALAAGIHPLLVLAPATIAASAAFTMPVATPPNAVVYASRLIPMRAMARAGVWLNLATVVLITLVFQFWVRRLWDIDVELPDWADADPR
jgi:sodium-dependent dicarboxylate transporter 2/3/5